MMENLESKIIELLRTTDHPLSFSEIVQRSGAEKNAVKSVMWRLVQKGLIKAFLRENADGKLEAVYIIL
ncbi:MAG: hypothetical protein QXZ68_04670 [Candidatus Bathyarchaeia archaeon]